MNDAVIRDIEEKDLPSLKSLIVEAFGDGWNLERFDKNEYYYEALLDIYLSVFLNSSTFGKVAEIEREVVGAVLASVNGEMEKFRLFQKEIAPNTLALLSAPEAERADIIEHLSTSFATIGQLFENRVDKYDGGLEFIAVSKKAQGLKIGKALWNEAFAYYKSRNVKSIYLITDSACNTGFYDYKGFLNADSKEVVYNYTTGQKKVKVFVYEYHF